jgi:hypothetical protein
MGSRKPLSLMDPRSSELEAVWNNLQSEGYEVRSPKTPLTDFNCVHYNCIAFAAGTDTEWWEPDIGGFSVWPIPTREYTVQCYQDAYKFIGYEDCDSSEVEEGFEKIVLYVLKGEPTHAAKQLPDGRWKSKLGPEEDIIHNTVTALEDTDNYGKAVHYMKRPIR